MDVGNSLSRYEVFVTEVTEGNRRKRQAMQYNVSATETSFLFHEYKSSTLYEVSVDGVLDVNGEIGRVLALALVNTTEQEHCRKGGAAVLVVARSDVAVLVVATVAVLIV